MDRTPSPSRYHAGPCRARRALTLVELVIVMALIAMLMVLIAPHLESVSGIGPDRQAQATATSVITAEVTLHSITGTFTADPTTLAGRLPGTQFNAAASSAADQAAVTVSSDGNTVTVAVAGAGHDCWILARDFAAPEGTSPTIYALAHPSSGGSAPALPTPLPAAASPAGTSWDHPLVVS